MTAPDSVRPKRAFGDTGSTTGEGVLSPPSDSRLRELATAELEAALDADEPSKKNYYIRAALQWLVFVDERPVG